jgi:hypothetical protein
MRGGTRLGFLVYEEAMRWFVVLCALALLAAGCGGSSSRATAPSPSPSPAAAASRPCTPATVHHTHYPGHGKGLGAIPWFAGTPREAGLVALAWYWPPKWRHVRKARIYTGGTAPQGWNVKVMWVFLAPEAKKLADVELRVAGRRLDGPGRFHDSFTGIGYEGSGGAPAYASIIDVPKQGCWRLTLTTGKLTASVDVLAVRG